MAQGKRINTDIKANIVADKINNPDLSTRDLAQQHGVGKSTVADIIDEIPEELRTSSGKGDLIIDTMDEIISEIADMTRLSMKPIRDKLNEGTLGINDLKALNEIAKNNFDRKQILTGKPTDIKRHEGLSHLTDSELLGLVGE